MPAKIDQSIEIAICATQTAFSSPSCVSTDSWHSIDEQTNSNTGTWPVKRSVLMNVDRLPPFSSEHDA